MSVLRFAIILLLLPHLAAQVEVGIMGGIPLTHFILDRTAGTRSGFSVVASAPRRYTVGPFVDFPIRGPLSLDAATLYKRFGFDTVGASGFPVGPAVQVSSTTTGNSYEFPLLAKIRIGPFAGIRPFIAAGPSIRHVSGITETGIRTVRFPTAPPRVETTAYETDSPLGFDRRTSFGVTFAAGLDFRAGPVSLAPGFRITRWDTERTSSAPSPSRLARTQTEFLLSVGYRISEQPRVMPASLPCCVEAGVIAAVPLTTLSEFRNVPTVAARSFDAPARRFAAGALLDWRFHARFSAEASFLTRRFGHTNIYTHPDFTYTESLSGYAWEAPLLIKWRATRIGTAGVWVGGGPALRRASHIDWISSSNGQSLRLPGSLFSRSAIGFAIAGGLELRAGRARLRPEIRYTRFERPIYDLYETATRQDSVYLLVGASWLSSAPATAP